MMAETLTAPISAQPNVILLCRRVTAGSLVSTNPYDLSKR